MDNLTKDRRLVLERPDCSPEPGRDLVVFRKIGTRDGRKFHAVIPAGKEFKPFPFRKLASFTAFSVTRQEGLCEEFQIAFNHRGHEITQQCFLTYRIKNPRAIAESFYDDPLGQVGKRALQLFQATFHRSGWSSLENSEKSAALYPDIELLRPFASQNGIELLSVSVARSPTEDEKAFAEFKEVRQQVLKTALSKVKDTDSAEDIRRIVDGINQGLDTIFKSFWNIPTRQSYLPSAANSTPALDSPATSANSLGRLADFLRCTQEILGTTSCEAPERRNLGSLMFHLLGEALADHATSQNLETQIASLRVKIEELSDQGKISFEQYLSFTAFLEASTLKQSLF